MSDYDSGSVSINGPINVTNLPMQVTALAGNSITGVVNNVLSTIVTYTAPSDKKVSQVVVSGTVYAKYQLFFNTVLMETRRGGPDRTLVFEFNNPLRMLTGDILDVKVIHFDTTNTADFESTVYGA